MDVRGASENLMTKRRFDDANSGYARLESQIDWYDRYAGYALLGYRISRGSTLLFAAAIPVVAALDVSHATRITAVLGALVVVVEGLQQLFQWHHNWISRRATCEL